MAQEAPCPLNAPPAYLEVWLEAGSEGRVFTYANPEGLGLAAGDLVRVRLQGRPHAGLVVAALSHCPAHLAGKTLQPVLAPLERAAVHPDWQQLISEVARLCHTSLFRTLRGVLPPGWLGARPQRGSAAGRQRLLIQRTDLPVPEAPPLPPRQRQLLDHLEAKVI
jgi:primosomal protein N' (replication factor Y)